MRVNSGWLRVLVSSACATAVAVLAAAVPVRAQVTVTEFPVPTGGARPYTIVAGPDGSLWFTESNGNRLGRMDVNGHIREIRVPTADSTPYGIAAGPDGNIWFTERFADAIGRIKPGTHAIISFPTPTPFSQPWDIAPGADGNLWFTEEDVHQVAKITPGGFVEEFFIGTFGFPTGIAPGADGNMWFTIEIGDMIGRIDPFGTITTFPYSENQTLPWDITPGPDGNVWFSELAGRAIGRITPAGVVVEHPIPGPFSGIAGVSAGWDGNIWYTENDTDHVGAIDVNGTVLPTYDTGSRPLSITPGPDGNMWYTVADGNKIGRVNIATPGTGYVLSMDAGFSPKRRQVNIGDPVKWMFVGPRPHSVADTSGLGLFNSGPKTIVSYFTRTFTASSTYEYKDGIPPATLTGQIEVPVLLPPTAQVGQPFPVTWATADAGPNMVFDVEVKVPGMRFTLWQTTTALTADYTAASAGTYRFRARMRNTVTGAMTLYSPPASVIVQ